MTRSGSGGRDRLIPPRGWPVTGEYGWLRLCAVTVTLRAAVRHAEVVSATAVEVTDARGTPEPEARQAAPRGR